MSAFAINLFQDSEIFNHESIKRWFHLYVKTLAQLYTTKFKIILSFKKDENCQNVVKKKQTMYSFVC